MTPTHTPPGKTQLNVAINSESRAILNAVLDRDGVRYSAQIERALKLWAKEKGIEVHHEQHTPKDGAEQ